MVHSSSDWPYCFSYVWEHLDMGYVQGMCDLLAPLLVILDDGEGWRMEVTRMKLVWGDGLARGEGGKIWEGRTVS